MKKKKKKSEIKNRVREIEQEGFGGRGPWFLRERGGLFTLFIASDSKTVSLCFCYCVIAQYATLQCGDQKPTPQNFQIVALQRNPLHPKLTKISSTWCSYHQCHSGQASTLEFSSLRPNLSGIPSSLFHILTFPLYPSSFNILSISCNGHWSNSNFNFFELFHLNILTHSLWS